MSNKIKIAVLGYGNLGRGVELAVRQSDDMELFGVFSRRNPSDVKTQGAKVFAVSEILNHKNDFDVLILCGGSATDLPKQTPEFVQNFNLKCWKKIWMHTLNRSLKKKKKRKR